MQVLLLLRNDRDSLDLKFYRIDRNYRVSYARRDHEEFLEDLAREKKKRKKKKRHLTTINARQDYFASWRDAIDRTK